MALTEKILIIQTIILGFNFLALLITGFLAWRIGKKQNEINKQSLDIQNFVETFVMPQQVLGQDENGNQKLLNWNLIVKNASSYPIYLNKFKLNGLSHNIGNSVIPVGDNNWYAIPIVKDVQEKGELSLKLEFEDYLGNEFCSKHCGNFENFLWQIKSEKRISK